jgi:hypothetical protein
MARVTRLAGAILAETEGRYFLVGSTKEPCDFAAAGLEPPVDLDAAARPWVPLSALGAARLAPPWVTLPLEGEPLARLLARRLLIERNGSVSERLWRLIVGGGLDGAAPREAVEVDARWLAEVPDAVWRIVRETVLRCT